LVFLTFLATLGADWIFYSTMVAAHNDSIAALGRADTANRQARDFFQAAQQPILWETYRACKNGYSSLAAS
jgi:hypothetical protein